MIAILLSISNIECNAQLFNNADDKISNYENELKSMIGKNAQNWILQKGNFISLSELRGNAVLLEFSGVGCGACKKVEKDICEIDSLYKNGKFKSIIIEFFPHGGTLINYNSKTNSHHNSSFTFISPNYIDYDDISKKYGVKAYPTFFLIDKNGVIKYTHLGFFYDNTKSKMLEEINKVLHSN